MKTLSEPRLARMTSLRLFSRFAWCKGLTGLLTLLLLTTAAFAQAPQLSEPEFSELRKLSTIKAFNTGAKTYQQRNHSKNAILKISKILRIQVQTKVQTKEAA
jgi:hypothetical protein